MNLYAYAGNNPVAFSDPFGLCEEDDEVCKDLVAELRTEKGREFQDAADRYDNLKRGRVYLVDKDYPFLDRKGYNSDASHRSMSLGNTVPFNDSHNVYIRDDLSKGDRLIVAQHESLHLAGFPPEQTVAEFRARDMNIYFAYHHISASLQESAVATKDYIYHRLGPVPGARHSCWQGPCD